MRAAVVGSGVAGMASALALARRGHEVTLFEAFEKPRPVGSGLLLQPSGLAALRALGLAEPVLELGARITRLDGRDVAGRQVMNMAYEDWRPGAFGLGVHRASLFDVLQGALAPAGVIQLTGCVIKGLETADRPVLRDAAGTAHGPYDFAVIADGSASRLRAQVRPRARAPVYPWGAVWANARDVDGTFSGALHQRYRRASTMMGVLPIGRGPDGEGDLVSVFWSLPQAEMKAFFQGDLKAWRAQALRVWPEARPLLDQFTRPSQFAPAVYRDVSVGRWSRAGLLLIGDAAHGTSPQLGQGGNLGLIDAVELAEAVAVDRPVAASLARFQAQRRRQTGVYQLASRALTPLFQSGGRLGPLVRDLLFTPLSRAPGLRWLSALVLTGVLRLGRTPPSLRP
ncbi:MAG TPA: NAD(P)/FAD-dependent oxidoreductase [Phenylobacterium sp.]|nr:NAD(P)/FAD-dependent oxidoreductase [Phenylobacterium sp.]